MTNAANESSNPVLETHIPIDIGSPFENAFKTPDGYEFSKRISAKMRPMHYDNSDLLVDCPIPNEYIHPDKAVSRSVNRVLGFRKWWTNEDDGRYVHVYSPDVATINATKAGLAKSIPGINRGVFVEQAKGVLSYREMAEFFAEEQIPIATVGSSLEHDALVHIAGYATMHEKIFGRIVERSREALLTGERQDFVDVLFSAELISDLINQNDTLPISKDELKSRCETARTENDYERIVVPIFSDSEYVTFTKAQNKLSETIRRGQTRGIKARKLLGKLGLGK